MLVFLYHWIISILCICKEKSPILGNEVYLNLYIIENKVKIKQFYARNEYQPHSSKNSIFDKKKVKIVYKLQVMLRDQQKNERIVLTNKKKVQSTE